MCLAEIEQTALFSFSLLLMYVEKAVKGERKKVLEEEEEEKHLPPNHLKMLFSRSENFFGGKNLSWALALNVCAQFMTTVRNRKAESQKARGGGEDEGGFVTSRRAPRDDLGATDRRKAMMEWDSPLSQFRVEKWLDN